MGLIEHLEGQLGEIEAGWSVDADGLKMPFQIARFSGGSRAGTVVFSTLGLSHFPLASPVSDQQIRHELLIEVCDDQRDASVPALLQQMGTEALSAGRAYLQGEVISPRGPLFGSPTVTALYVAIPVYFPDSFAVCRDDGHGNAIVIAWLVPNSTREAAYVAENGWSAFEDRLIESDPDLIDVFRDSLPL